MTNMPACDTNVRRSSFFMDRQQLPGEAYAYSLAGRNQPCDTALKASFTGSDRKIRNTQQRP